jgi:hypothetical protein
MFPMLAAIDVGSILQSVLAFALPVIVPTLATALTGYLLVILHRLAQKWGLNLSAEQDAKLEYYATKAAAWVEEEAARRLTRKDPNLTGDQMRDLAIAKVKEWLPNADTQKAADTIQAVLPQMGLGAAASLPKVVQTTESVSTTSGPGKPVTTTVDSETVVSGKTPGTPGQ